MIGLILMFIYLFKHANEKRAPNVEFNSRSFLTFQRAHSTVHLH